MIEVIRHPIDKVESKYNPDTSGISKEEEERYQKLVGENEDLQRLIGQVSEKCRRERVRVCVCVCVCASMGPGVFRVGILSLSSLSLPASLPAAAFYSAVLKRTHNVHDTWMCTSCASRRSRMRVCVCATVRYDLKSLRTCRAACAYTRTRSPPLPLSRED